MQRIMLIMEEVGLKQEDRSVVAPAREYAAKNRKKLSNNDISSATALAMEDGTIITGKELGYYGFLCGCNFKCN